MPDADGGRFAESGSRLGRLDKANAGDAVPALSGTGRLEAVARTEGLTAEPVRAETILQIAREAMTAIESLYGGMQKLAELALDETLSAEQRAQLDAAFRELRQDIEDIVEAAVFDGEPILKGGNGPDGEYVVRLSAVVGSGELLEILISSGELYEGLREANLLTVEAARAAFGPSGRAAESMRLLGDRVALHREALQRIFSSDVAPNAALADFVVGFAPPAYVESLSHLVADIVLAGGGVPFEESADRLRDILARADRGAANPASAVVVAPSVEVSADRAPPAPSDPGAGPALRQPASRGAIEPDDRRGGTGAPVPPERARDIGFRDGSRPRDRDFMGELARADDIRGAAGSAPYSTRGKALDMRAPAEEVVKAGENSPGLRAEQDASVHAIEGRLDTFPNATAVTASAERRGEEFPVGGEAPDGASMFHPSHGGKAGAGYDVALPSLAMNDPLPDPGETDVPTAGAALPAIGRIDRVVTGVVDPATTDVREARNRVRTEPIDIDRAAPPDLPDGLPPPTLRDVLSDAAGDRVRAMVSEVDLPRPRELDMARRVPGQLQQISDVDTVREAGASLRSAVEEPLDRVMEHGAPHLNVPDSFMAELRRADGMLHVADLSIEQIDLHLDYMRGLAEEASFETSRARGALDELFQVVKSNIIDTLAQTAEAQGEKILSGGDGPDGEFIIRLSQGGDRGDGHEFAIPSMRIKDLSPDLYYADIRTREAATAAVDHVELAGADVEQARDRIAEQRALIRRLIHMEIAQNGPGSR